LEGAPAGSGTDVSKYKEVERLRLSKPTAFSIFGREATRIERHCTSASALFRVRIRSARTNVIVAELMQFENGRKNHKL
jgi:hypothetical protein